MSALPPVEWELSGDTWSAAAKMHLTVNTQNSPILLENVISAHVLAGKQEIGASALLTAAVVSRPEMFSASTSVKSDFSGLFTANYLDINHNSAPVVIWSLACSGMWRPGMSAQEHVVVASKSDISTAQKKATVTGQKDLMPLYHVTGNLVRNGLTRHGARALFPVEGAFSKEL